MCIYTFSIKGLFVQTGWVQSVTEKFIAFLAKDVGFFCAYGYFKSTYVQIRVSPNKIDKHTMIIL